MKTSVKIGVYGLTMVACGVIYCVVDKLVSQRKKEDITESERENESDTENAVEEQQAEDDEADLNTSKLKWPSYDEAMKVIEKAGYSSENTIKLNYEKPSLDEMSSAHPITAEDYISDSRYLDYEHVTCTWYIQDSRLVNLSDGDSVIVDVAGSIGEDTLDRIKASEEPGEFYCVNHKEHRCYEIISLAKAYLDDYGVEKDE